MANKKMSKQDKTLLAIGAILLLVVAFQNGWFGFFGAVINPDNYNGDMEQWCINTNTVEGRDYGTLADGTSCTAQNSRTIPNFYDGTHNSNMLPLYWKQTYGCCVLQSEDAYSGQYAAQFHKESKDDWYGLGMTASGTSGYVLTAKPNVDYTLSLYYKMDTWTGRNPSLSLRFYDKNGNEILRETKGFEPVGNYTYWEHTVPAPAEAKTFGWDVWFPPESEIDLYIDELRFDEAEQCTAGQVEQCGTDLGVCQYGVRTCQADGFWGACEGGIAPTPELCTDADDNNCNGKVNEGCSHETWSLAEYKDWFDLINMQTYDGTGYSTKNSPTWWAWDNAPIVEADIHMYEATGDTSYLNLVVANTDLLISKASDYDNDGLLDWEALESPIDPILTYSRNLLPMIRFAYVVKRDNLAIYDDKANQYIDFVEDNFIPLYEERWAECGDLGFWQEGNAYSAPNNRVSYVARIYAHLYAITDNSLYKERIDKFSNKFLSTMMTRTDGTTGAPYYYWNYNNQAGCITNDDGTRTCNVACAEDQDNRCLPYESSPSWSCNGDLEIGYGNYDVAAIVDLYEIGTSFTSQDIQLYVNTVKEGFLDTENYAVDGAVTPVFGWSARRSEQNVDGAFSLTAGAHQWMKLGQYDAELQEAFEKIAYHTIEYSYEHGDWYAKPYLCYDNLQDTEGEVCGDPSSDSNRATPAYTLSMIGNLALDHEELSRLSAPVCSVNWDCTEWSSYTEGTCGVRTRTCTDLNSCGEITNKPAESESLQCPDATCGNNEIESGEFCDGNDLDGEICQTIGYTDGSLACLPDCSGWDVANCEYDAGTTGDICIPEWDCTIWSTTPDPQGYIHRACLDLENCDDVNSFPEIKLYVGTDDKGGSVNIPDEIGGIPSQYLLLGALLVVVYLATKKKGKKTTKRRKK